MINGGDFPLIVLNHDVERIILLSELTQKNLFDPFPPPKMKYFECKLEITVRFNFQ